MKSNVFICPPCGESVAQATKEGQNKNKALWPLLPRLTAVLPPQGREMSFGFTLIELLVVVLIIGILAAVAVPQYQKAVWKARLTEAIMWNANAMKAMELWVLENGEPTATKNFTQNTLDIEMPPLNNNYLQASAWGNEFEEPDNWASVITAVAICEGGNGCNHSNSLADVRWEKAINGNYNSKTCTLMNEKGKKICSLVQSIDSEYVPI